MTNLEKVYRYLHKNLNFITILSIKQFVDSLKKAKTKKHIKFINKYLYI